ncbi:MAG: hypothetical protein LDL12_07795 [Anaerolinea sp.]|nr:hypothetical protein [Anaerolinea sp.]
MPAGTPFGRQWVLALRDGRVVLDWGNGLYQDTHSGEFLTLSEAQISHCLNDEELEWLKTTGRVSAYDGQTVYLVGLPDRPLRSID